MIVQIIFEVEVEVWVRSKDFFLDFCCGLDLGMVFEKFVGLLTINDKLGY